MIIPGLNIFKYIQAHLLSCFEFGTMDQFRFESFEKAFSHRVISTVTFPTHILLYPIVLQQINGLFTGILDAAVRVKGHIFFNWSVSVRHPDSRYDSIGSSQVIADRPTKLQPCRLLFHENGLHCRENCFSLALGTLCASDTIVWVICPIRVRARKHSSAQDLV